MGRWGVGLAVGLSLAASSAWSQDEGRVLRVVGEAVSGPPKGAPARFVIDAVVKSGDDPFKADIEGWLATLGDDPKGDDIDGACVEGRCAFSLDLEDGKLAISADLAGKGPPGAGRMVLTDEDGKTVGEAQLRFSAIAGPVDGLGELAPPGAIGSLELTDLLVWNGVSTGFSNVGDEPVGGFERSSLADWQSSAGRPGAGLILIEDLALLRSQAAAAKAKLGWTSISGPGWKAGYPSALMPVASTAGTERRFASADGRLQLVIAVEPAMNDADWDANVERLTADQPGVERHGYTRVNDDMEIAWTQNGRSFTGAWHNRDKGLVHLEFSAPEKDDPTEPDMALVLPRSLVVEGN